MMRVWRLSVAYIGPKLKTEMLRKTKIDIIGLSLLRNDVDCRHFKDAARSRPGRDGPDFRLLEVLGLCCWSQPGPGR